MVSAVESSLDDLHGHCTNVRLKVVDQADVAGGGHYGSCFSCVEILVALYYGFFLLLFVVFELERLSAS